MNKLKKFLFKFLKKITVISLIIFCIYLYYDHQKYGYRKFDKELWDKEYELVEVGPTQLSDRSSKVIHYRCGMYNDLVKNHLKKGMKVEEVIKVLGKTDLQYYCIDKKVKCLYYDLGGCLDYFKTFLWIPLDLGHNPINICFDSNNQYISAGLDHYSVKICGGENKVIGCFENKCGGPQRGENGLSIKFDYEQW